jgi:capsular exopolysaccharide synthesis family protein
MFEANGQNLVRATPVGLLSARHRDELLIPQVMYVLRRRRRVIAGSALIGLLLAISYALLRDARYDALAQIEVRPANTNSLTIEEPGSPALTQNDSAMRLQAAVKVLQSNSVAFEVIDQLALAQDKGFAGRWQQPAHRSHSEWPPNVRDHLLRRFEKALAVELISKTDIIAIHFRAKSPELAAAVANAVVEKFRQRSLRTSYESASQVSEWLSKQLEALKSKARQSQEQLAALERTSGLLGQDETDNIVFTKLKELDEQLTVLESDRIVKEARYRIAASGDPELLATSAPDATLQVLRAQQAALHAQYAQLTSKFGTGYPKTAELGGQVASADAAIERELKQLTQRYRNDYEAALGSEQMLRAGFEAQKEKAYRLNEDAAQHAILKREVEGTQQLYETLQLKLKEAGIAAGLASANIDVIDPAEVPSQPCDPKPLLTTLLGLGAGLLCGAVVALAMESMDDSIRSQEEAEQAAGVPALGCVPSLQGSRKKFAAGRRAALSSGRILMLSDPMSRAAESYRGACQSLLLTAQAPVPKVISIASALPFEGKTTTAVNCAVALAQLGSKVLLVDADFRQPEVHQYFGMSLHPGLRDRMNGDAAKDLRGEETAWESKEQPGLWLMPAGSDDGERSCILDASLGPLVTHWREGFDYVVIDTPPMSLVSDALVVATHSDAVLLVVRTDMTSQLLLRRTCEMLQRANAHVAGFVLNGVELGRWYGGYGISAKGGVRGRDESQQKKSSTSRA